MSKSKKAVAYIRMSTDAQDKSPARQRAEIEQYAEKRGYQIAEWYVDEGISGDKTDKRIAFKQMIADGLLNRFGVIVCEDQDRFGRFDSIEAGHWIYPLRRNGIVLDTVTDGLIDWDNMTGRLMYSIKQEGKHAFLVDLSNRVHSAHKKNKNAGKWTTGLPPYGYEVNKERKLVPGAVEQVKPLKEIFARYASGYSLREIAAWLNGSGIPTQRGKTWSARSVSLILANERYLGHMFYDQRSTSKYRDVNNPQGKTIMKPRDEWTIVTNTHTPLVDLETWAEVQERRTANAKKFRGPKNKNSYALRSILFCSNCGSPMGGHSSRAGKISYQCSRYNSKPGECERRTADEREVLREVLRAIREQIIDKFFGPAEMEQITESMRKQLAEGTDARSGQRKRLTDRIDEIDAELQQSALAIIQTAEDLRYLVENHIRKIQNERDKIADELSKSDAPIPQQIERAQKRINAVIGWLGRLEDIADADYDAAEVSRMLSKFVARVELHIEPQAIEGSRYKRQKLTGGIVYFSLENFPQWVIPASENLSPSCA